MSQLGCDILQPVLFVNKKKKRSRKKKKEERRRKKKGVGRSKWPNPWAVIQQLAASQVAS